MARPNPPTSSKKLQRRIRRSRAAVTDATRAAREALVQADVLGLAAYQARIPSATKGVFSPRELRSSGDLTSYMIGAMDPMGGGRRKGPKRRRK